MSAKSSLFVNCLNGILFLIKFNLRVLFNLLLELEIVLVGAIELTLIPYFPKSRAEAFVNPSKANLLEQ